MPVMTFRQALHDTLRDEMLRDENVVLMGEEIGVFEGSYKITAGLLQELGEKRIRDTPIAEEGFVGAAECAVWVDRELYPVTEGRFAFDPASPMSPWTVGSADGAVDLRFEPAGLHAEHKNFGIIASRFIQPVGMFRGAVRAGDRALELDRVWGVVEDQEVLW